MPTYEFKCTGCNLYTEKILKIKELEIPVECNACGLQMERIFSTPGIIFNGTGFYRTDNRK